MEYTKYIVWINYGCEGWKPTYCQNNVKILKAIQECYNAEYIVTERLNIQVVIT